MKALTHSRRGKFTEGFTFIEVMVAITLLVLSMAGAYQVVNMSMQARQNAHNYYTATIIANNRIERAKNVTFDNLAMLVEDNSRVNELGAPDLAGRYYRTTTVDPMWGEEEQVTRIAVVVQAPAPTIGSDTEGPSVLVSTLLTTYLEP